VPSRGRAIALGRTVSDCAAASFPCGITLDLVTQSTLMGDRMCT
jgi:hypothetical protein